MAGVPDSQYDEVVQADELLNESVLNERLDFLKEVRAGAYEDTRKVWALLRPEVWERYKLLGQNRLAEQILLRKKMKLLKKAWNDRYGRP